MKGDRNVELKTTCQQYIFELMFRAQEVAKGDLPTVSFTHLQDTEIQIKACLQQGFEQRTREIVMEVSSLTLSCKSWATKKA